jgi:anion-transporting  ArsA/GET3 family ATPase
MTTAEATRAATASPAAALLDRSLVFVTGKGGAGKTTVAAALGLAAAARGCRTMVCDLAGSGQLARAFGTRAAAAGATAIGECLWSLSVDPQRALEEWLRRQPGGAAAVAVLTRSSAFEHFVAAAPAPRSS